MSIILLKEYARRLGKNPQVTAQKAERGGFVTAHKIGRQWFIDEDEPYVDGRVTNGKYIGARRASFRGALRMSEREKRLILNALNTQMQTFDGDSADAKEYRLLIQRVEETEAEPPIKSGV